MAAAVDTIAELGFANASLARIAQRIGVSKGVISYHFAGKDELVREIIRDVGVKGEAFILDRVVSADSAAALLRGFIVANLEFMDVYRKELQAFMQIAMSCPGNPEIGPAVAAVVKRGAEAVRDLLAAGQASGELRPDFDPEVMAMAIRSAIDAVPPRLTLQADFDVAHYSRELADLFVAAAAA